MIKKLSRAIIEHRYIVFGLILSVTVFFGFQMRHLIIRTQLEDLFPADHPFIKVHEKYKDQLGSPFKVFLMLKVKDGDIYNNKTLAKIRRINDRLDAIPGANHNHIYSIGSQKLKKIRIDKDMILTEPVMNELPSSMTDFKEIIQSSSGIFGVWVSRDNKSAVFTAEFIQRGMDYDVIFKALQKIKVDESDDNHVIYRAGEPVLMGWVNNYQPEMWWIFGLTFLSLFSLLYVYFRNVPGIVAPVSSTVVGGIWGLGFCGLVGFNLEPLILVIPLLISARALSHSVQITERYFECYHKVGNVKEACIICMSSILPPGTLGIVTDALGILFIAVAPVPIIQKLAYLCSFWAISIIISGLLFTPLLLSFLPPAKNISKIVDSNKGITSRILSTVARMSSGRGPGIILVVVMILAGVAGFIASKIKIGDVHPGSPILWEDSDYNISVGQINESFPGTEELYVLVEGNGPRAVMNPGFLKVLDTFQRYMERSPLVGRSLSVADLVPTIHRSIYAGNPKFETLPLEETQSAQMFNQIEAHSAPGDYDLYFSRDGSVANVIIWYKDHKGETLRSAVSRVNEFVKENKELLETEHCTFQLASGNLGILAAVNDTVEKSQLLNFALVMGTTFFLCWITYRSIVAALFLIIPLNVTNIIVLSIMSGLDIGLNINTLPVVSVGVGVGIDYGIYLLSRLCEEFQIRGEYSQELLNEALTTTGKAIFFTATTMVVGVIFWYFLSSMKFQAEMGLLLAIIMFINMIGALVIIPALVFFFRPKFLGKVKLLVA